MQLKRLAGTRAHRLWRPSMNFGFDSKKKNQSKKKTLKEATNWAHKERE